MLLKKIRQMKARETIVLGDSLLNSPLDLISPGKEENTKTSGKIFDGGWGKIQGGIRIREHEGAGRVQTEKTRGEA